MTERERMAMWRRMTRRPVSRRGFLKAGGLGATSAFLAACTGTQPSASAPPTGTVAPPSPQGSASPSAVPSASYATEGALFMYNWADYVDPENIEEFKRRYDIDNFT